LCEETFLTRALKGKNSKVMKNLGLVQNAFVNAQKTQNDLSITKQRFIKSGQTFQVTAK
jgi:hypothetical protein